MSYELDSLCEYGHYTQSSKLCSANMLDVLETSLTLCLDGLPNKQLVFPRKELWNFHKHAFNSSEVSDLIG